MRILGSVLVLCLLVWLAFAAVAPIGYHPTPEVLGIGSAFEGNLQLPDDSAREQAAHALSEIVAEAPLELTLLLEKARLEGPIHGLLRALGYLRAKDRRTVAAILGILDARPDTADALYEKTVWALGRAGKPAVPQMVAHLEATKNPIAVCGIGRNIRNLVQRFRSALHCQSHGTQSGRSFFKRHQGPRVDTEPALRWALYCA